MGEIYIQVGKDNIIQRIHRTPFDPVHGLQESREELLKKGVFVDDVPEPKVVPGKRAVPKYNYDTQKVYYDYVDIPLTANERLDMLEGALTEMLLGGEF